MSADNLTARAPARPGSRLRASRNERQWTVAEVAAALRLTVVRVEALEGDDYPNLPGKTYVLGYWRSYANLLGIDLEDSIAAHKGGLPDEEHGATEAHPPQWDSAQPWQHGLAFLFALPLVIFLAAIWYWQAQPTGLPGSHDGLYDGQNDDDRRALVATEGAWSQTAGARGGGQSAGQNAGQHVDQGGDQNVDRSGAAHTEAIPIASIIALPEPNFPEESDPFRFDAQASGAASGASSDTLAAQDSAVKSGASQPDGDDATAAAQSDSTDSTQPKKAEFSPNQIVFAVHKQSWLEVRDAAGERLIYRTVHRGQRLTLKGKPPFSAFIGDAEGVVVEYQGELVPLPTHSGRFARLHVGVRSGL